MDCNDTIIESSDFWADAWIKARRGSVLATTQEQTPLKWKTFYDNVSDIWPLISGNTWKMGHRVYDILISNGVITTGHTIIDLGCGVGAISIPFASNGLRVVAVDNSEKMLEELTAQAKRLGIKTVETVCSSWDSFRPSVKGDMILAACFPDAFTPEGIKKLEQLSSGHCCFVFPVGEDPFPLRRLLWESIMKTQLPKRRPLSMYVYSFLLTSGRTPGVVHRSWTTELNIALTDISRFYIRYFAIFGYEGKEVEKTIRSTLETFADNGRVQAEGETTIAVIWW